MRIADHIDRIRREADALARVAEAGPFDARVPPCPDWDVEALVRHMGDVHRWAGTIVRERLQRRLSVEFEGPPGRDALMAWYREGYLELIAALEGASTEASFWFWGPAPDALSFWARRQANETTVHRCDAEAARGQVTPLSTGDGLDALEEFLALMLRRVQVPQGDGRTIHLHATDGAGEGEWLIRLGSSMALSPGHAKADCALRAPASDLFLWAMNRRGTDGMDVIGDRDLVRLWRECVRF